MPCCEGETMNECSVCLVDHQPDIHNATLSIRRWVKEQIRIRLEPIRKPEPPAGPGKTIRPEAAKPAMKARRGRLRVEAA